MAWCFSPFERSRMIAASTFFHSQFRSHGCCETLSGKILKTQVQGAFPEEEIRALNAFRIACTGFGSSGIPVGRFQCPGSKSSPSHTVSGNESMR